MRDPHIKHNFQQYSTYDCLRPWRTDDAGLYFTLTISFQLNLFD